MSGRVKLAACFSICVLACSGGAYAQAAAIALLQHTDLTPADIVKKSLTIAGDLCIYTNQNHTIETLE